MARIRGYDELWLGDLCHFVVIAVGVEAGCMFDDELEQHAGKHCPAREIVELEIARREELER